MRLMNFTCLLKGHAYKFDRLVYIEDSREGFLASNGIIQNVTEYEHECYICTRCLKRKLLPTGEKRL